MSNPPRPLSPIRAAIFNIVKRTIDIVSSIILLLVFSPILLVTAFFVYRTSKNGVVSKYPKMGHKDNLFNNIFFCQKRVGPKGEFTMYKFHSMYIADNDRYLKEEYPTLWDKYKKNDWKLPMDEDPRITPVGKVIRTTSVDEMPQFFNVLKGDMSLVGPRAYREEELQEYERKYPKSRDNIRIIRSAKPGITGLWQISGRNQLDFEKRAELDANYIKNRSLRQEMMIILKTPKAMLSSW
jgi:lipopolysaccharide/colanic/teichoic acid biosynthesis glycosyltransferase